mgnify:CR=1 FL=1|jgi:hypothetical protein
MARIRTCEISDEFWALVEPLLPQGQGSLRPGLLMMVYLITYPLPEKVPTHPPSG